MNIRRYIFFFLILLPTLALIIAIITHRPPAYSPVLITAAQLQQTQTAWANQTYVPISTNAEFTNKIYNIRLVDSGIQISSDEISSLRGAVASLVFANYLGDYDAYRKFRTPILGFELPSAQDRGNWEAWFQRCFTNTPVPTSLDIIINKIWVRTYGNHPYWTSLGLDKSSISLMVTNNMPGMLPMDLQNKQKAYCMESVSKGTFSYNEILKKDLIKKNQLKIAKLLFWADTTDPAGKPRPFCYVMVLDADSNVWLPIEMAWCSTANSKHPAPF